MTSGIYKITHSASGKVYVGSAVNLKRRWNTHRCALSQGKHHSGRLQNAWNKYGGLAFEFSVLEYIEQPTKPTLIEREQFWIDELNACGGYNIAPRAGSTIGKIVTEETKAKMRASSQRGKPRSAEIRAKISAAQKGKPRNPASIMKMAETKKGCSMRAAVAASAALRIGQKLSAETIAKRSAKRFGMRHTAEAKAKMSASRIGKPLSAATCAKLSAVLSGKPKSPQAIINMTIARRKRQIRETSPILSEVSAEPVPVSRKLRDGKREPFSVEHRANISFAMKGKPKSAEHKVNWLASMKAAGHRPPALTREQIDRGANTRRGVKRTPEQIARITAGKIAGRLRSIADFEAHFGFPA